MFNNSKKQENFLLYIPVKKHKAFEEKNNRVYLIFHHDKLIEKIARKLFKKPAITDIDGIGGEAGLPAPQATLMSMVVQGVMDAQLPWTLVLVGAAIGIAIEILGLPVLPVALGIYLPINLSVGILAGGIVRVIVDKKFKHDEEVKKEKVEKGILISSGLVAGDALIGILVAGLTGFGINEVVGIGPKLLPVLAESKEFALVMFLILTYLVYKYIISDKKKESKAN